MKTRYFITGLLCLLAMENAFAQSELNPKDSIVFEVEDKLLISIDVQDYDLLRKNIDIVQIIQDFQNDLQQVEAKLPAAGAYRINYDHNSLLEIEEMEVIHRFRVRENQVKPLLLQNQCEIKSADLNIHIYFADQQDLLDPGLANAVKNMLNQLPLRDRHLKTLRYETPDFETLPVLTRESVSAGNLDMLSLGMGVGANMIYNQFLADLSGELSLQLNHKGILKNQFYISNNLLFSFDPERQLVLNNFTNFGYRRNLSNQLDKSYWLGIELGAMTSRSGGFFPENTYRVGVNWEAGKNIFVMPSLYFNGFFKQVSPGIRIGFGI